MNVKEKKCGIPRIRAKSLGYNRAANLYFVNNICKGLIDLGNDKLYSIYFFFSIFLAICICENPVRMTVV